MFSIQAGGLVFVMGLLSMAGGSARAADPARFVLPKPKEVVELPGVVRFDHRSRVEVINATEDDRWAADVLRDELLPTRINVVGRDETVIRLEHLSAWTDRDLGPDGYTLEVSPDKGILARATTSRGLSYAVETLLQLVDKKGGIREIPALKIVDWPETRDRVVTSDLRAGAMTLDEGSRWIRALGRLKINRVVVILAKDAGVESGASAPGKGHLNRDSLVALEEEASRHHIELQPRFEAPESAEGKDLRAFKAVFETTIAGDSGRRFYDLARSAQFLWSSAQSESVDFNVRFAAQWFHVRDPRTVSNLDRAFNFLWRAEDGSSQGDLATGGSFYSKIEDIASGTSDEELQAGLARSAQWTSAVKGAEKAISSLERKSAVDRMAIESLRRAVELRDYIARKVGAISELALSYRRAFEKKNRAAASASLDRAVRKLQSLQVASSSLENRLRQMILERGADPQELTWLAKAREFYAQTRGSLEAARAQILGRGDWPSPEDLGLR